MDAVMPSPDLLRELEEVAATVARACGRLVLEERPHDLGVADTKTSATDVVTLMDRRSEDLARRLLLELRPDDGLVGEEGLDVAGTSGISWLVDPIDGTVNYLYRHAAYAVSVAAVVGDPRTPRAWTPVAGAVCQPVSGELYRARRGGGARLEEASGAVTRLRMDPPTDVGRCLVGTGFSYRAEVRERQARVLVSVLPRVRDIRRVGVAALDLCDVARGRLDASYEGGLNPWDFAAGWVIVEEAGGVVRGPGGLAPTRGLLFAGAGASLDTLEGLVVGALGELDPDAEEPAFLR